MLLGKKTINVGNLDSNEDMYEDFNYRCEVKVVPDEKPECYSIAAWHASCWVSSCPTVYPGLSYCRQRFRTLVNL